MSRRSYDTEGGKVPLNMRTTQATRRRLEEAAAASGRSLAHEVEYQLERALMASDLTRAIRETIRQEMRAEFEARREPPIQWQLHQRPADMKVQTWP